MDTNDSSPFVDIKSAITSLVEQDSEQFLIKMAAAKSKLKSIEKRVSLLERIEKSVPEMKELERSLMEKDNLLKERSNEIQGILKEVQVQNFD